MFDFIIEIISKLSKHVSVIFIDAINLYISDDAAESENDSTDDDGIVSSKVKKSKGKGSVKIFCLYLVLIYSTFH